MAELSLMPRVVPQVEFVRHAACHISHVTGLACSSRPADRAALAASLLRALRPVRAGARGTSTLPP